MEKNKLCLKFPVLVEGKYDKIRLSNIISSSVITLGGFSVFKDKEKIALIRRLIAQKGIIILTDSDNAGMLIRNKLKGMFNSGKIINVYVPRIKGKEKRKDKPSKEGIIGVEGISDELIRSLLVGFSVESDTKNESGADVTNAEFFADGFSGRSDSENMRKLLAKELALPENMTSKALLEAINMLINRSEYDRAIEEIKLMIGS